MTSLLRPSARPALYIAAAIAGCRAIGPQPSAAVPYEIVGSWGGDHVWLILTREGGRLEYDCASGAIAGPVRVDAGGNFSANGTHSPGQGGPEREGDRPPMLSASYSGSVQGDRMTLFVRVPSRGIGIGPLRLRRGADPVLFRCLSGGAPG
jgi:hypothetical protein